MPTSVTVKAFLDRVDTLKLDLVTHRGQVAWLTQLILKYPTAADVAVAGDTNIGRYIGAVDRSGSGKIELLGTRLYVIIQTWS